MVQVGQLHQEAAFFNEVGVGDVDAVDGCGDGRVRRGSGFDIAGCGKAGFRVCERGLGAGYIDGGVAAVGALLGRVEAGFGRVEAFLGGGNLAG
jgi:hypothetical protein